MYCEFNLNLAQLWLAQHAFSSFSPTGWPGVILAIIVLAILAGEDQVTGIAEWAWAWAEWWLRALGLKRKTAPHRTTYSRVLTQAVRSEDWERMVSEFLAGQPGTGTAIVIRLDGKTLRGTIPVGETRGVYLLAAYLP